MMADELQIEEPQTETEQTDPLGILAPKKQTAQADPLGILKKKVDGSVSVNGTQSTSPSTFTSKSISDVINYANSLKNKRDLYRASQQAQQPAFNPKIDKATVIDANVTIPTNLPKQDEQEYNRQLTKKEAIVNTLKKNYERRGQKFDENSPNVKKAIDQISDLETNADVAVAHGKDGKPYIVRGEGFLESAVNTLKNSFAAPFKAYDINTIQDPSRLADALDTEINEQPDIPESAPTGLGGGIGEMAGGIVKPAALLGLNAAVPGLGTAAMTAEAYYTARANQIRQLYQRGLAEGLNRTEAAQKAKEAAGVAAIPDAAMAYALSGEVGGLTGRSAVIPQAADQAFRKAFVNSVKSVGKIGGFGGLAEGVRAGTEALQGYDVNPTEVIEKAWNGATEWGKMDLGFKIAGGLMAAPKYLKAAALEYLSNAPKDVLEAKLADAGETGQQVQQSLQSYQNARKKVEGLVPEEHIANYAGLIEKQDKIKQSIQDLEMRKMLVPEPLQGKINEQITENQSQVEAIDKQMADMSKSDDPSKLERDDLTGQKAGSVTVIKPEENKPVETTTIAPQEYTPKTKKSGVSVQLPKPNELKNEYDGIFTTLRSLQSESNTALPTESLPNLSERIYQELEKGQPESKFGSGEVQRKVQDAIEEVFGRGDDSQRTLQSMSESELRDASRRLYAAIGSDVVLPQASQTIPSERTMGEKPIEGQQNINETEQATTTGGRDATNAVPNQERLPTDILNEKNKVQQPTKDKESTKAETNPVIEPTEKGETVKGTELTEPELTGVSHAETDKVARELGLPEYEKNPETVEEWDAEADKRIQNDPDSISKLLGKLKKDEQPDKIEQRMMAKYLASLKAKIEKEPTNDALINDYKTAKELSDKIGGREVAKSLRARQDLIPVEDSIGDLMVREMETLGVDKLTDKQKEDVVKDYEQLKTAKEQSEAKLKILEDENAKLKAEAELKKITKGTTATKKSKEDVAKVRQDIKASIKDKWKKAANDGTLTAVPVPYAKQLAAIAPDVAKLVKSYVEEGVTELKEVVKRVVEDIREFIPEFTERDAHDIIRGEYTERKPTRNELSAKLKDIKDEVVLIDKLEKLNSGEEPATEKKKIERNQQIAELQKQVKEHDVTKLSAIKKRSEKEAQEIQDKINKGEYAPEPKNQTNILEDKELQKKYPKIYKEALDAKDRLIKLKQEREIKFLKQQYANRSRSDKAKDTALEVLNVPRSLMSSFDFSAPLRQGVIPTIAHPKIALKAAGKMFENAFSQKKFDRYFSDLRETPEFKVMEKSGLYVADPHDHKLSAKEELFMNNLAEKIPLVGKIVKGSERAYVSYLNKMRIDIFQKGADLLAQSGKTPENSPESYKGLASWVNNSTGRGGMTEKMENAAPILNSLFFSPRLIASRLNILGLSDIATGGKGFYSKLPKEIRKMVAHDLVSFVGFGAIVLALAKLNGADVETDPRSSDFGKMRFGDTRYDIWGGFQQYIRFIAQMATGKQKSSNSDRIRELNGKDRFGKTRADVAQSFFRGKLAPVPSMLWDFAQGRTAVGQKATVKDELIDHFTPLIRNDIQDAWKEQGAKSLLTIGLPATFGIGVQTYDSKRTGKTGGAGAGGSFK